MPVDKKIALIYDWLVTMGGGERVLSAIAQTLPGPIYTLLTDEEFVHNSCFKDKQIHTSFLQHLPFIKRFYRHYLPFFPRAVESFSLQNYDCILSIFHCVAKGVLVEPHQLHICYCFTPMRYAWDLFDCYMQSLNPLEKMCAKLFLGKLRAWDLSKDCSVHHYIAVSHFIAERIRRIYAREAQVIYPPVATDQIALESNKEDFFLTVSRMVPYKKIDLIVEAFSHCPDRKLIVIGDGPQMGLVKSKAKKNCEILGAQSDAVIHAYMQKARGFVFAAEEDFGIVVVEAQAAGTPVIAFGRGGALETVIPEKTGIFFDEQCVLSIISALKRFDAIAWDPQTIRQASLRFSTERFCRQIDAYCSKKIEAFYESGHFGRR